jgi:hypothetical protein
MRMYYAVLVCLLWVIVHFLAAHVYVRWCVPPTWYGLFMTPFVASAPHCTGIRWVLNISSDKMVAMWSAVGLFVIAMVL